jgi:hypothetical protein
MALRTLSKSPGSLPAEIHVDSFVSERLGWVYHCIPKTLSRSMLHYLGSLDPDGYRIGERGVGAEVLTRTGTSRSFTFARNPYSRIVAVYFDKFVNYRATQPQREMFGRFERLQPEMTFSELVDWLATDEGCDGRADPHFLSQHYFVLDEAGAPAVDYLGKVENLQVDLPELQALLGLTPAPLPHLNRNADRESVRFDSTNRWREVLDDRSTRILNSRYDGDFEVLGYERLGFTTAPLYPRRRSAPSPASNGGGSGGGSTRRLISQALKIVNKLLAPAGLEVWRTGRAGGRPSLVDGTR